MPKRIFVGVVVAAIVSGVFFAPRAEAQLATFESNPAVVIAIGQIAGAQIAQRAKEDLLDGLAWTIAKVAVQSMTRSIVTWINSGYQGAPAFSQNLNRDLRRASDAVASGFINDFFTQKIDTPFLSLARDTVSVYYLMTSEDALAQRLKYSLGNFAQRSTDYIRGDWSGGGLSGWYGLTFRCENDPNCASFLVHEALAERIDANARKYLAEFNAGRGFLSWKGECKDPVSSTSLSDEDTCTTYDVLTPGSVVEQTLVQSLGSPIRQLELADSINEIVSAVVMQMVNQVLGGGGLAGLSSPSSSGGSRPIDQATNPGANGTTLTSGFSSIVRAERDKTASFRQAWVDIRDLAATAKDTCPVAGGAVSLFRASTIQDTLDRANAAVTKADAALSELEGIITLIEGVGDAELPNSSQAASSQRAFEMYQQLLSSGSLVSANESAEATKERDEDNSDSLYSKMAKYVKDCD